MAAKDKVEPLQGGSDTLGKFDADKLQDRIGAHVSTYVDLKVGALDAKLGGEMKGLEREVSAKLDGKPSHGWLIAHTLVILGAMIALLAFGGQQFIGGMGATGVVAQQTVERKEREDAVDRKLDELAKQIAELRKQQKGAPK